MLLEIAMTLAMQDATTVCQQQYGGRTTCETTRNTAGMDAYNAARESAMRSQPAYAQPADPSRCAGGDWFLAGCTLGAHREAVRAREAEAQSAAARQETMRLLRAGDCSSAILSALDTGDLEFAAQVRTYCATPAPQQ